jgi:hypothetical protein
LFAERIVLRGARAMVMMVKEMVLLRLLALSLAVPSVAAAAPEVLHSGGLSVRLDPARGTYGVDVDGQPWILGGGDSIALLAPKLLRQVAPPSAVERGSDVWGSYEKVEMYWGDSSGAEAEVVIATSVRAYSQRELVVFAQRWPHGFDDAAARSPNSVIAPFPSFTTQAPADAATLNFLQWGGCQLANSFGGRWTNASSCEALAGGFNGRFGCQHGIPTVLYSRTGRGAVLSPARNWLTAVNGAVNDTVGFGVSAAVRTLPADFLHETVLVGGGTVNESMHHLGDALLLKSGKPRSDPYDDFVLGHLGYWTGELTVRAPPLTTSRRASSCIDQSLSVVATPRPSTTSADNGAFFDSSNNHSGFANHEEAILAMKKRWTEQKIPFRYVQMDDWQWHGASGQQIDMGGIVHWPPDSTALPDGLSDWLGMPTSQYSPMYAATNVYITDSERYNYSWAIDSAAPLGGSAVPTDVNFYRDMFRNGSRAQMKMFEQDFLCTYASSTNLTNADVSNSPPGGGGDGTGMKWLRAMDVAAVEANISLQLCMMCPVHVLASTELTAVTNGRGTSDNDHSSQADLYPLGHSGLLMGALGLWTSRDNVFTSPHEPNCAKGNCTSPDYRLQNVAAILGGGPCECTDTIDPVYI